MTATSRSLMASAGTGTRTFRKDVQGIRTLAVTMVVLYHAGGILPGGFVGVDVFFVISGFVITGLLSREFARDGDIRLRTFYALRARRLLPAVALMSTVVVLASTVLSSPFTVQGNVGSAAVAAAMFSSNFFFMLTTGGYFQAVAEANPFVHTWSLAVEEQFYLVFPIVFLFLLRLSRRTSRRFVLNGFALMALLSFVFCLVTTFGWVPNVGRLSRMVQNRHDLVAFYMPMSRAWEFMTGAIVYMLGPHLKVGRAGQRVLGVIGLCGLGGAMFLLEPGKSFPGFGALLPVLGTAALLVAGFGSGQHRLTTKLLSGRMMIWLGDRSYSWYLWHWPFIVFAGLWFPGNQLIVVSAVAASLSVAAITYRFFERPIHRLELFTRMRSRAVLIVVCISLPITLGFGLAQASARSWGRSDLAKVQADIAPLHEDQLHGCARTEPLDVLELPSCIWGRPGRPMILLIGDSNAGHLTEPLVRATERLGYRLEVITNGGCPMIVRRSYSSEACRRFVTGNLKFLGDNPLRYRGIVISNASTSYVTSETQTDSKESDIPVKTLLTADSESWAKDVRVTMGMLPAASGVVVVGAVPQYSDLPECLVPSILSSARVGCGEWGRGSWYLNVRSPQILAESRAVHAGGGVYLDTARRLCTAMGGCSAFGTDGRLLYKDGAHLSVSGSMIFAGDLEEALRSAVR